MIREELAKTCKNEMKTSLTQNTHCQKPTRREKNKLIFIIHLIQGMKILPILLVRIESERFVKLFIISMIFVKLFIISMIFDRFVLQSLSP